MNFYSNYSFGNLLQCILLSKHKRNRFQKLGKNHHSNMDLPHMGSLQTKLTIYLSERIFFVFFKNYQSDSLFH